MTPQSKKSKGRSYQKLVRDKILAKFPELEPDDVRSTSMGNSGEDLQLSPAARRKFPFQIECKSLAKIAVYKMYEQAKTHGNYKPLVCIKQNGDIPLVILSLDDFMDLL